MIRYTDFTTGPISSPLLSSPLLSLSPPLTVADIHTYYVLAGSTPVLVHNTNYLEGCPVNVNFRVTTNSAGDEVARGTVQNEDDLLGVADHLAGGSLDDFVERKPDFYRGTHPDGSERDIEWNPVGHLNPPEGPHVKMSVKVDDPTSTKGWRWRAMVKVFIEGRETK